MTGFSDHAQAISSLQSHLPEIARALRCPSLEIVLSPNWGAGSRRAPDDQEYRHEIRRGLLARLLASGHSVSALETASLLDLSRPPRIEGWRISVSHCAEIGGFALARASQADAGLGFDVETESRVRPALVARVSSPEELHKAPSPACLWVAKESLFKALDGAVKLVSELTISSWQPQGPQGAWLFLGEIAGQGVVFQKSGVIFSMFLRRSK
jgi:hypothetical protein